MTGTTPNGWPYVTPDDHPLEFPAHSQALAQKLEAVVAIRSATVSLATNWAGSITLKRYGTLIVATVNSVRKVVTPTANELIGSIPTGFRPDPVAAFLFPIPTADGNSGTGTSLLVVVASTAQIKTYNPAPAEVFQHSGVATWYTPDA